ncbi:MAG: Ig-like domain-containing protein [Deltaproteobacteria bacterium]|nr:Ig-like domain-containing protein [Deltaproteobacteria bacterium]
MRVSSVVVAAVAVVGSACCDPADPEKDRTAPRVLAVDPADPVVPVDSSFTITFSERIEPSTVEPDPVSDVVTVILVVRSATLDALVSDFNSPPLSESRQDEPIPIDVDIDGDSIEVRPLAALEPRTAYELLLGSDITDPSRNPLVDGTGLKAVFRYDFETDGGQPTVIDADVDGPGLIAPNRRRMVITFNQPVQNVGNDTVTLSPPAPIDAILASDDRTNVTLLIGAGVGCSRLEPSTEYTLAVSAGVVGDTGQALAPFSSTFNTGAACDTAPNVIVDGPEPIPGEVAASIRWETTKASTTEVRFGLTGGPLDCLGAPCPVAGAPARLAISGSSPPRFLHSLELAGLTLDASYDVVVSAEDDVGNTATASTSFVTAPLPKVALNEVMANPSTSSESTGEYVELVNFGEVTEDISGWLLLVDGGDEGGGCTAELPDAIALGPGDFLIIAGATFNEEHYTLSGEPVVKLVTSSGANAMCGLTNEPKSFLLADSDGRPVSTISSHPSTDPDENGLSVERIAPAAGDVEASFCLCKASTGPTPGRANSVTIGGCDP